MVSLAQFLLEIAEKNEKGLLATVEDSKALRVIKKGLELRDPDCGNFWDDFISICGDSEGLSELLNVPQEKIAGWRGTIKSKIHDAEKSDKENTKRSEMISTGEPDDQDQHDIPTNPDVKDDFDGPADTRPMP